MFYVENGDDSAPAVRGPAAENLVYPLALDKPVEVGSGK